MSPTTISERRRREGGFTLASVLVLMTVMLIFIAYTVPRQWSMVMARERDRQTLWAMKQYARSILEYQKRHGGLPTSLDQLKDARKPRFVRGPKAQLVDPLTGEVDWLLVPPQQPGQPTGQPLTPRISGNMQNDDRSSTSGNNTSSNNSNTPVTQNDPNSPNNQNNQRTNAPQANKDYVGPFVGVRPNKTGKSFLAVNGADSYEEWTYTVQDLTAEINARAAALLQK